MAWKLLLVLPLGKGGRETHDEKEFRGDGKGSAEGRREHKHKHKQSKARKGTAPDRTYLGNREGTELNHRGDTRRDSRECLALLLNGHCSFIFSPGGEGYANPMVLLAQ